MKITTTTNQIKEALQMASKAVVSGTKLSESQNVLLSVDGGKTTVSAFNYSVRVSISVPVIKSEDGKVTTPCKALLNAIDMIDANEVTLSMSNDSVSVVASDVKINLETGRTDDFSFTQDPPETPLAVIDGKTLKDLSKLTLPCVAVDETRPQLIGINVKFDADKVTFEASDGAVACITSATITNNSTANVTIPAEAIKTLLKMIDDKTLVLVFADNSRVWLKFGNVVLLCSRLMQFPDLKPLIPTSKKTTISLAIGDLKKQIAKIDKVIPEPDGVNNWLKCIKFEVDNVLKLSSKSGKTSINMDYKGEYVFDGKPLNFGLSTIVLKQVFSVFGEAKADIALLGPKAIIVVKSSEIPNTMMLVMPVGI